MLKIADIYDDLYYVSLEKNGFLMFLGGIDREAWFCCLYCCFCCFTPFSSVSIVDSEEGMCLQGECTKQKAYAFFYKQLKIFGQASGCLS